MQDIIHTHKQIDSMSLKKQELINQLEIVLKDDKYFEIKNND